MYDTYYGKNLFLSHEVVVKVNKMGLLFFAEAV